MAWHSATQPTFSEQRGCWAVYGLVILVYCSATICHWPDRLRHTSIKRNSPLRSCSSLPVPQLGLTTNAGVSRNNTTVGASTRTLSESIVNESNATAPDARCEVRFSGAGCAVRVMDVASGARCGGGHSVSLERGAGIGVLQVW